MKVGLLVMATGNYRRLLPPLIESAGRHVVNLDRVFLLSDELPSGQFRDVHPLPWGHMEWPLPTLCRYRAFSAYSGALREVDWLLYVDADTRIVNRFDCTGIDTLFAVRHPGYVQEGHPPFPVDSNPRSPAYQPNPPSAYYCGGVQGGPSDPYLRASEAMADRLDRGLREGEIPLWHDESMWNAYLSENPSFHVAPADFCRSEGRESSGTVVLALEKGDPTRFRRLQHSERSRVRLRYYRGAVGRRVKSLRKA